jgi:hypothetical protein
LQEWRFIRMIWRWWKVYQDSRVMNEAITKTRGVGDWISSVIWRWSMYLSGRQRIHEIILFWELGLELQQNQMWHPGAINDKSYYLQGGGQIGSCLKRKKFKYSITPLLTFRLATCYENVHILATQLK